jgi:hypothetical protein
MAAKVLPKSYWLDRYLTTEANEKEGEETEGT